MVESFRTRRKYLLQISFVGSDVIPLFHIPGSLSLSLVRKHFLCRISRNPIQFCRFKSWLTRFEPEEHIYCSESYSVDYLQIKELCCGYVGLWCSGFCFYLMIYYNWLAEYVLVNIFKSACISWKTKIKAPKKIYV